MTYLALAKLSLLLTQLEEMNSKEGKEDERSSVYRKWRPNTVTVVKMWKKTAERKLFSAERMWTNSFSCDKGHCNSQSFLVEAGFLQINWNCTAFVKLHKHFTCDFKRTVRVVSQFLKLHQKQLTATCCLTIKNIKWSLFCKVTTDLGRTAKSRH